MTERRKIADASRAVPPYAAFLLAALLIVTAVAISACGAGDAAAGTETGTPDEDPRYPPARRAALVERMHGVEVADPYRWLEDPASAESRAWLEAQEALFARTLETMVGEKMAGEDEIASLSRRLEAIQRYESIGLPRATAGGTFIARTPAGAVQPVLWLEAGAGAGAVPSATRPLFDAAAELAPEERLSAWAPSPDGKVVALVVVTADSNWGALRLLDVASGGHRPLALGGVRGGVQWTPDSRGFFYIDYGDLAKLRRGEVEPATRIRHHRLGQDPARDPVIYAPGDDQQWLYTIRVSHDGRYLVVTRYDGRATRDQVLIADLRAKEPAVRPLIETPAASYAFEGSDGDRLFLRTDLEAPRGRVVAVDVADPRPERWRELIPESEHAITAVSEIGERLVVRYTVDAMPRVRVFDFEGRHRYDVELPAVGWIGGFPDDRRRAVAVYSLNGLADPGTIYSLDLETGDSTLLYRPALAHDPDAFVIEQVFYRSQDGTRVPMFIARARDVEPSPSTPLFLYGYGHGGWSAYPWFQPRIVAWMELGGIYALPGVRGGGEYGAAWQEAGTARNKQNAIDDYLSAAAWLVEKGYTSKARLVANGGSASGVLAAAAAIQRPEAFGAVMIDFPFLDMLRYHRFTTFAGWVRGYGTAEDAEDFAVLRAYSPYHNLVPGRCYPATLVQVGEVDETTVPMHGYKFVAALQAAQGCDRPVLLALARGAKHAAGADPEQRADTWARELVFLDRALGGGLTTAAAELRRAVPAS